MNLKEYINSKNETVNSLSKKLNIPYTTLREGLDNPKQMRYENLIKLTKYFGISLDYLSKFLKDDKITLLNILIDQMESKLKGNLYHYTQINFAYNTNRIEGSNLTEEQTRLIFETNTIGIGEELVNTDDLIETVNSFYLFDEMLKSADSYLSEEMIKRYHQILKNGTNDSRKDWFVVGGYKKLPNEVGGKETTSPKLVEKEIRKTLKWYNSINEIEFSDVVEFHYRFEKIHPFQDGNGRIGRLIMFKECLKNNIVPFIVEDKKKTFYYRGLNKYQEEKGYLIDTCLSMQDKYIEYIKKYLVDVYNLKKIV